MSFTSPQNINLANLRSSTVTSTKNETNENYNPEIKSFKQILELIPKTYLTSLPNKYSHINPSHSLKLPNKSIKIIEKECGLHLKNKEKELKPKKRIKEIKAQIEEEPSLFENNNFPKINRNYMDIIQDSSNLIKEKKSLYFSNERKKYSLNRFINESKEITIKNFLLELLNNERNNLVHTGDKISRALTESDLKLCEDYNNFEKFTEDIKNRHKEMDKNYYDLSKDGREYYKKKKKLMQENKLLMDDVDRTLKMIFNLKEYSVFINRVFEDENLKFNKNSYNSKNLEYDGFSIKEKDLEKLTEQLMYTYIIYILEKSIQHQKIIL